MTLPSSLGPVVDAIAPLEHGGALRRIRSTAMWLAIASWLLPDFAPLGTATTQNRIVLSVLFAAAMTAAFLGARWRYAKPMLLASSAAAGAAAFVLGDGTVWGIAFFAFTLLVLGLAELRARHVVVETVAADPDPSPARPGIASRVLGVYAWLGISILLVKEWSGQLMLVPTGSMQPTIMGAREPQASGDSLLSDHFSYLFREPRRFEIVVFEFPLFRERLFVKRLIGLPGEHVEIRDGDVWIDGEIARKSPVVQHTLWRELHPRPSLLARPKEINDAFQGDGGAWSKVGPGEMRCASKARLSYAAFAQRDAAPDVRIALTASADPGSAAVLRATSRGTPVRLVWTPGSPTRLEVGGDEPKLAPNGPAATARLELCVADGEAWASVDGAEVARAAVPLDARGKSRVDVGAAGAGVSFRDVTVARDIVWEAGGGPSSYDVPEGSYFFLGDNVKESDDSRRWAVDVVRPPSGAEFRAPHALLTEMGQPGPRNLVEAGANWRIVDVDGIVHEVPRDGTRLETGIPAPFARREHLVGRAIMILFPWTRAEAGFRPRLLP